MKRLTALTALGTALLLTAGAVTLNGGASAATRTATYTTIAGVPAGDLDESELRGLLRTRGKESDPVTVVLGTTTVVVGPHALGLSIDVAATARRALAVSGARHRLGFGSSGGRDVVPVLMTHPTDLRAMTSRLVAAANVPESHGRLVYVGNKVTARPPSAGQSTTAATVEKALRRAAQRLPLPSRITVPVTAHAAHVGPKSVQELAARANALAGLTTTLRAGSRTAPVAGGQLARHLTVAALGEGPGHGVTLGIELAARAAVAAPLAAQLSTPATEPRVQAPPPTAVLTTQGNVAWRPRPAATTLTAAGNAGQTVSVDAVLRALLTNLQRPDPQATVTVPRRTAAPRTSDKEASTIDALLGSFTTPFQCCQPRVRNIGLMARTIDGTIIAPGESFSLNNIVGRRTKAKGYVEAPFILDGELSSDVGGGVSQVATTTLNAAFFAGLRLDRHQAHSFYISRYPAGREATVNYPSIDLRWTNTTTAAVLVRAATTERSLTVAIYGHDDGRSVQAVSGPRLPVAGRNFRISVTRMLQVPGRPASKETFTTTYNKPPEGE